jgi:hypothetical protein
LLLLNPESEYGFLNEKQSLTLGAEFTYKHNVHGVEDKFLLKITVHPQRPYRCALQIAQTNLNLDNESLVEYIIQTYAFLFSR